MDRTRLARLCCLPWPRGADGEALLPIWRAPCTACSSPKISKALLGAFVFPCALLKGALVVLPACVFATVGSLLILPTCLARCILNTAVLTFSSATILWQRRLLLALLLLPLLTLWLPVSALLVAVSLVMSFCVSFIMAFNATYIAAFYWPENDIDDPMEFQVPQHWLNRLFFGFSETFVCIVDAAEWVIEYYLDYLEPLSLHYVDPISRRRPPSRGAKRPMRVATQAVEEGNGQRKIAEHFVLGAPGTANVLFTSDPNDPEGVKLSNQNGTAVPLGQCYKGGELGADAGHTFCNPLSVHSVRITLDSDRDDGGSEEDAPESRGSSSISHHSNNGTLEVHTSTGLSPRQSARQWSQLPLPNPKTASEWSIIRKETLHSTGIPLSNSRRGSEDLPVPIVTNRESSALECAPLSRATGRRQRSFGEWGLERSRTYGPCDARSCGCESELRPGAIVATVLYRKVPLNVQGGEMPSKLWRFCPKPECFGAQPEGIDLPPLPTAFPIDRLARVTILEQLDLDKLGVKYFCT